MRRILWTLLALALIILAVFTSATYGWAVGGVAIFFAILPDVALIGAFDPERKGMLRPERVLFYNVMHLARFPVMLAASGALIPAASVGGTLVGAILFTAGVSWLAHIAVDRAAGYALRDRDGAIRTLPGQSAPGVCQA